MIGLPLFFREYENFGNTRPPNLKVLIAFTGVLCINFYLNYFIFIPQLLFKNKRKSYFLAILGCWGAYFGIAYWLIVVLIKDPRLSHVPIPLIIFPYALIIAVGLAIKLLQERNKNEKELVEREAETLKSELAFLRSQISPHFLFNIMNNVVSLSRLQPSKVEPTLMQLSSLMRYMLYESDEKKVDLRKEKDYLQDYINLQELRFGDDVKVDFKYDITETILIEPMLLIPFVENAFKHGIGLIQAPEINIFFQYKDNVLIFKCLNKFINNPYDSKDDASGIGIRNVQRRLELLYPKNHILNITEKDNWYEVRLEIIF